MASLLVHITVKYHDKLNADYVKLTELRELLSRQNAERDQIIKHLANKTGDPVALKKQLEILNYEIRQTEEKVSMKGTTRGIEKRGESERSLCVTENLFLTIFPFHPNTLQMLKNPEEKRRMQEEKAHQQTHKR